MSDSLQSHGLYSPWNSLGQNTGVCSLSLLQGIFPTHGSNPGLLHGRRTPYQLSHKGSTSKPFSSVQFSHSVLSDSLWPHESQHARPPCPSPTPRVYSNSCASSRWCYPAISSSVIRETQMAFVSRSVISVPPQTTPNCRSAGVWFIFLSLLRLHWLKII